MQPKNWRNVFGRGIDAVVHRRIEGNVTDDYGKEHHVVVRAAERPKDHDIVIKIDDNIDKPVVLRTRANRLDYQSYRIICRIYEDLSGQSLELDER